MPEFFWRGMPAAVNSSDICPLSVYSKEGEKWSFKGKFFALSRSPRGARGDGRTERASGRPRPSASVVHVGPFALPELIWHTAAHASLSSPSRRRWGFSASLPSFEGWRRGRHACDVETSPHYERVPISPSSVLLMSGASSRR